MDYPRLLTIQDISCVGQCSLTVALPILSACGIETCILPSAVLSTHTGGFSGYTFRDLTDDMPSIARHWAKEGILFDAFYTGYLGSEKQITHVLDIFEHLGRGNAVRFVDPAMADNGYLYAGFDMQFVCAMKELARHADYLLPNITEACLLTDLPYIDSPTQSNIGNLLSTLHRLYPATVILTGVSFTDATTGVIVSDQQGCRYYEHEKLSQNCHGTGDIFASACIGAILREHSLIDSAALAADYTVQCMKNTIGDPNHPYGAKFETALADFIQKL